MERISFLLFSNGKSQKNFKKLLTSNSQSLLQPRIVLLFILFQFLYLKIFQIYRFENFHNTKNRKAFHKVQNK